MRRSFTTLWRTGFIFLQLRMFSPGHRIKYPDMARIPEQFIDDLISRTDIAEVIDHRVPLQRAGAEFRACCPFHNEKTPSFYVSPAKQFYHCFGCGAHGTAISFLMNYDNMEFLDAIDVLAAQAGMIVPKDAQPDDQHRKRMALLHDMVDRASRYFQTQLKQHPQAKQAVSYLKDRGLDGLTAAQFGMGFAPEGWDGLIKALGDTPENLKLLAETGLVIEKDEGGYYDRFRGRVMFPIEDYRGKLVGFGGRIIGKGEPKYLNSPETKLFHKGSELYGLHRARREMGQRDEAIVVEGYMDVVGLAQCGVKNAVATLGTATTPDHLQRLFRAASKVVFCFDGDRAGRKAAWRALEVALPYMEDGRQIRFLMMPEGEDPDSLIRKEGQSGFETRLEAAVSMDHFLFDSLISKLDMSEMDQRAKLSTQARPLLQKLPDGDFKSMMYVRLGDLVGVVQKQEQAAPAYEESPPHYDHVPEYDEPVGMVQPPNEENQLNEPPAYVRHAIALLIQFPELVEVANEFELQIEGAVAGVDLLDQLIGMINVNPEINTAQILERQRGSQYSALLSDLAMPDPALTEEAREPNFRDAMQRLERQAQHRRIKVLLRKSVADISDQERATLNAYYRSKNNE